jgi:hypothetical protein
MAPTSTDAGIYDTVSQASTVLLEDEQIIRARR